MGSKRRGFTLVELLVVIAIISILLSILIPVLGRAKATARRGKCATNLHSIIIALRMYRDDWEAYPHPIPRDPGGSPADYTARNDLGSITSLYLTDDLGNYLAMRCPDDQDVQDSPLYSSYTTWPNADSTHTDGVDQLYNWYGYDENSAALETMQEAEDTYAPGGVPLQDHLGRPMWVYDAGAGPGTWTGAFRGLANRNAPETTVITHCPYHRANYRPNVMMDVIAFLGGNVEVRKVVALDWIRQENK